MAADVPVTAGKLADVARGGIGFVGELPDHLLDDVLDGDDAGDAAVLVGNDRQRRPLGVLFG
jgi:hypothetical protein